MKYVHNIFMALLLAGVAVPCADAGEAGSTHLEQARATVERSALSKESKSAIMTNADRAVTAGVPPEDVSIIVTRGLKQEVDGNNIATFLQTAARAKEQNLPVRMLLDRTEQGLAKGVPPDKIAGVTQRLSGHLSDARPIVHGLENSGVRSTEAKGSDDAVETVARALEKAIPKSTVAGIGEKVNERKGSIALFNRAVDTMITFAGNGMAHEQCAKLVGTAVGMGYSERDLEAMERYMVEELRANHPMNEIVSDMNSHMEHGDMLRIMERQGGMMGRPGSGGMGSSPMGGPRPGGMGSGSGMTGNGGMMR